MATNPKDDIVSVTGDFSQFDSDLADSTEIRTARADLLKAIEGLDLATPDFTPPSSPDFNYRCDLENPGVRIEREMVECSEPGVIKLNTPTAFEELNERIQGMPRETKAKQSLCELFGFAPIAA